MRADCLRYSRSPKPGFKACGPKSEAASALIRLIERVGLKQDGIDVSIKLPIPSDERRDAATPNELALARFVPMRMKRRGVEMRLIIDGDARPAARIDLPLLTATARAYRWSDDLLTGRARSIGEIAKARTSYGPSRAARDAAGVSGAQDRRGDRRRPPACEPYHRSDDPENRSPPLWSAQEQALEHPIDSRGGVACVRRSSRGRRFADGHAKIANREF